ncbi:SH3 domain-containing protein [Dactylonectria estremocensis]|uniref:SH3 domain-containing protein n=1 Tax=Dactylonectria estremocensis TaxID=1079267 RepID=A0A9P9FCU0_9HYPO|nr:SH3 domain-containing protein [Dactylonectria estremocensis]
MSTWRSKTTDSMQSVQTRLGKLVKHTPTDDHNVTFLIKDYEAGDIAISKIINEAKCLQVGWHDMAVSQLGIASAFQDLYAPIEASSAANEDTEEERRVVHEATPHAMLERTSGMHQAYSGLHEEMRDEITAIETLLLRPASDAKDMIQPIKKTIKKREKMRVDFENAQAKVTKLQRKPGKSAKEETQLAKAQGDLSVLSEAFETADSHLRETLPPLVQAVSSLLPNLLASVILIQNRLLGLCYTVVHEYCQEHGFPSPSPPMHDVITEWEQAFTPIASEVENFSIVRKHLGMRRTEVDRPERGRTPSSQLMRAPLSRISSASSQRQPSPARSSQPRNEPSPASQRISSQTSTPSGLGVPTDFTAATVLRGQRSTPSLQSRQSDYFGQAAIAKKKPPPPPPGPKPKRQAEFVEAQYDFQGQGADDLSFRAGDRIRIIHKTDTDQDWWTGELRGYQGNFPANYCAPVASN